MANAGLSQFLELLDQNIQATSDSDNQPDNNEE
jgi:hypothetical protein